MIKNTAALMLTFALASGGTLVAQEAAKEAAAKEASVKPLMSKDVTTDSKKALEMIMVEYPPGSQDPAHMHHAQALVYVLEGSIVMQVKGGKQVTLTPGQTFYEGPDDVHVVGRNASKTAPAKFLVILLKDKGAPILVPATQ